MGDSGDTGVSALASDGSELINCNYTLYQGIDGKGQVQTRVRVSDITLTYDGLPTSEMIEWALDSRTYLNGSLVLYDPNNIPLKKLFFQDAACVGLHLNFISPGKSSVLTQIKIKPRKLIIDGVTIDQKWIDMPDFDDISPSSSDRNSLANVLFSIAQTYGKLSLDLFMDGRTYEIENFDISVEQGSDFKGQPQEEVHAGIIKFTIPSMPDRNLEQWMMRGDLLKSGVFAFKVGDASSPLKIGFNEAYCINMTNQTARGKGVLTNFIISANEICMNDKYCCNHFKL